MSSAQAVVPPKSVHSQVITMKTAVDLNLHVPHDDFAKELNLSSITDKNAACFDIAVGFLRGVIIGQRFTVNVHSPNLLESPLAISVGVSCGSAFQGAKLNFTDMYLYISGTVAKRLSFQDRTVDIDDSLMANFLVFDCGFVYTDAIFAAVGQKSSVLEIFFTATVSAYRNDMELEWGKVCTMSLGLPSNPRGTNRPEKSVLGYAQSHEGPRALLTAASGSSQFCQDRLTDFVIVAGNGASLFCHRSILAMKSPVLKRMLLDDVKETNEGELQLRESGRETLVQADVAEVFLKCIYDDVYEIGLYDGSKLATLCGLFHMYEMQSCLHRCSAAMVKHLSQDLDAAVLFLPLAKAFDLKVLLAECADAVAKLLKV